MAGEQEHRLRDVVDKHTVTVRISHPDVLNLYADLSTLAKASGWAFFHGKNDLWVAAAARATNSCLLTMDKDCLPLRNRLGWTVTVLDERSGRPLV